MTGLLRWIFASAVCLTLAQQGHAAKWGKILDKGCSPSGHRLYTAKIWTGIGDKGPSEECRRTEGDVAGKKRLPNNCVNNKVGRFSVGVVYGEWYIPDTSCEVSGQLRRSAVMPTGKNDPANPKQPSRTRFATDDPLVAVAYKLEDLGTAVVTTFQDMKAVIEPVAGKLLGTDKLIEAAKSFQNGAEYAKFAPLANDLSAALKSDNSDAIAARAHILNGDSDKAMASLAKLPAFVTLSETVKKDPVVTSFSIGLVGDAQYVGTVNGEVGVAFGPIRPETGIAEGEPGSPPPAATGGFGYMTYYGLGYGAGATKGADASIAVGLWRGALNDLEGDSHGVVLGIAYKFGVSASFWWGYATDTDDNPNNDNQLFKIKPSEFLGFVIAPQAGYSVEAEYNRAFMKSGGPVKIGK
ncbi:MAG: hypothetical protein AAGI14_10715 [Pseudomonadota bacterium]